MSHPFGAQTLVTGRSAAARFVIAVWLLTLVLAPVRWSIAQDTKDETAAAANASELEAPRKVSMLAYLLKAHSDPFAAFIGLALLGLSIYFFAQVIRFFIEFRVEE